MKTQNKGEWSELYVKWSLLTDSSIKLINVESNEIGFYTIKTIRIANKQYMVLGQSIYETIYNLEDNSQSHRFICFKDEMRAELKVIKTKISQGKGSFSIPEAEFLAAKLGIDTACNSSHDKGDITLQSLENGDGKTLPNEGFSLKSFIGNNPSLVNASAHSTRLKIKINNVSPEKLFALKSKGYKARQNMNELIALGASFSDVSYAQAMEFNLAYLNAKEELTAAVIGHFTKPNKGASKMNVISEMVENPEIFRTGMQKLLRSALIGMNPSDNWSGAASLSDNLLLVLRDGTCHAFLGKKTLETYLYDYCYMDAPSQTRHDYGYLYEKDNQWYIDLNFQIRLKNMVK